MPPPWTSCARSARQWQTSYKNGTDKSFRPSPCTGGGRICCLVDVPGRIRRVTEQNDEQLVGTNRADSLPTSWEPQAVEKDLYEGWVNRGYFTPDANSEAEGFSIVLPPPNVTGQLHMGHALDHTLIDSIIRRKRMQGYSTLWLPGADHAGIATQTKVEAKLKETEGKKRWDYEREEFIEKVWEWKEQYGGTIQNQMRAIGDSVDWSRERFTLDEGLSRAVQTIFKNLYDEGLIYRANRLVNWSPVLETAVSDIEVVYKDVEGELVSIRYGSLNDDEPHLIVATTRVETMLGDVAIAVHPDDERYAHLVGQELDHPFRDDLKLKVIADDYVDMDFGTGAVKITPAHDPNDYAMGTRHNLDMPTIMDTTGRIAHSGTRFDGMTREEARVEIREALREQGRIVKEIRPYVHSVGHSERSGEPVEPRLSSMSRRWQRLLAMPCVREILLCTRSRSSRVISSGLMTCMIGVSPASCGGATASLFGTAQSIRTSRVKLNVTSCASAPMRSRRQATNRILMSSIPGSLRLCGHFPPWAGPIRPRIWRNSIPLTCWSPPMTSCFSGSLA